jgi:hypothetical protein
MLSAPQMTWFVMCPRWQSRDHMNKVHGWSLSQKDLVKIGSQYFDPLVECIVCGHKFSLQQGLKEAFSSDNPFMVHRFQFNALEQGMAEIEVGQLKTIKFAEPFEDLPQIYLSPHKKPVAAVAGHVTAVQFSIFSSDSGIRSETREIGWAAYGNRKYAAIPIWRKLLASSKEHQLRKDFRQEVVDLESAFEVFIGEYLGENLKGKLRAELVSWILKEFTIDAQLKMGFIALTGKTLSELEPKASTRWHQKVKELRDHVVHRGDSVNEGQAKEAREATFDLITRIDGATISYF